MEERLEQRYAKESRRTQRFIHAEPKAPDPGALQTLLACGLTTRSDELAELLRSSGKQTLLAVGFDEVGWARLGNNHGNSAKKTAGYPDCCYFLASNRAQKSEEVAMKTKLKRRLTEAPYKPSRAPGAYTPGFIQPELSRDCPQRI